MRITIRLTKELHELLNTIKGKTISDKIRNAIKFAHLYQEEEKL